MEIKNNDKQEIAYQDDYFARRHWVRKIWQTLVALLCWLVLLTPCVITLGTYLAYVTDGRRGFFFWHYREGFGELDLLIVLLVIIGVVTAIFCLLVGAVQNRRRKRVLEKTPQYDQQESTRQVILARQLAVKHFGARHARHTVRYYEVKPAQNFTKDELRSAVQQRKEGQN